MLTHTHTHTQELYVTPSYPCDEKMGGGGAQAPGDLYTLTQ